jgi:hypothetical protein
MNVIAILAELRSERDRLDQAIIALQRLASGKGKEKEPVRPLRKQAASPI